MDEKQIKHAKCRKCGKTFAYESCGKRRTVCPSCRRNRAKEYNRNYQKALESEFKMSDVDPIGMTELHSAKKKPKGCSGVMWRIELRRRRNARFYSTFGVDVRHLR